MAFTTLISTDVLAAQLNDPALVVIDCRFKLDDVAQACGVDNARGQASAADADDNCHRLQITEPVRACDCLGRN